MEKPLVKPGNIFKSGQSTSGEDNWYIKIATYNGGIVGSIKGAAKNISGNVQVMAALDDFDNPPNIVTVNGGSIPQTEVMGWPYVYGTFYPEEMMAGNTTWRNDCNNWQKFWTPKNCAKTAEAEAKAKSEQLAAEALKEKKKDKRESDFNNLVRDVFGNTSTPSPVQNSGPNDAIVVLVIAVFGLAAIGGIAYYFFKPSQTAQAPIS